MLETLTRLVMAISDPAFGWLLALPRDVAIFIVGIGTGETHHLLEALARHMLDAIAARFSGVGLRLELRKLNPPDCPGQPAFAAVRMARSPGETLNRGAPSR